MKLLNKVKRYNNAAKAGLKDSWEIYMDKAHKYRWRRYSMNNNIVGASSQGYKNRHDCELNAVRNGLTIGSTLMQRSATEASFKQAAKDYARTRGIVPRSATLVAAKNFEPAKHKRLASIS